MNRQSPTSRRNFVKLCASALTLVSASPRLLAQKDGVPHLYHRAKLVDSRDRPITPASLKTGETYLFNYPFVTTPCFLIDLGKSTNPNVVLNTKDGRRYEWKGGVGPQRSIVAFSAICAHRMSYPAREVSFINYRHETVSFKDKDSQPAERAQVIYCCSEKSVYDPSDGARVLGGPAPQPLAAILLEHRPKDGTLYATGTYGGEMFEKFLKDFSFRLMLEIKSSNIREEVKKTVTVVPMANYCRTRIMC